MTSISERECSKKSVQQGRSLFDARSVLSVREHGKKARTPLAAFVNIPIIECAGMAYNTEFHQEDTNALLPIFGCRT